MARGEAAGSTSITVKQEGLSMGKNKEKEILRGLFLISEDPYTRTCTMGMENITNPLRDL